MVPNSEAICRMNTVCMSLSPQLSCQYGTTTYGVWGYGSTLHMVVTKHILSVTLFVMLSPYI
jgi:hypothetical protein